jgi:hypothetical protein
MIHGLHERHGVNEKEHHFDRVVSTLPQKVALHIVNYQQIVGFNTIVLTTLLDKYWR